MSTFPHKNHVIIIKKKKKLFYCLRHGYFTISHFQSFDQKQRAEKSIEKEEKKEKSLPDGGDDGGWGWESRIWVLLESLTSAIGKIYELYIHYFAAKFAYPS